MEAKRSCLVDQTIINAEVFDLVSHAEKSIYISRPMMDLVHDPVMLAIGDPTRTRTPNVFILMSSDGYTAAKNAGLPTLPPRCTVRFVRNFGPKLKDELIPWTRTVESIVTASSSAHGTSSGSSGSGAALAGAMRVLEDGIYKYNQPYMLIDDKLLVIGPIGSLPVMIVGRCTTPNFPDYVRRNWDASGSLSTTATMLMMPPANPEGILLGSQIEETICQWIDEAKYYCYLETSVFISQKETKNKVAQRLVKRLIRSYEMDKTYAEMISTSTGDPTPHFKCLIVTNPQDARSTAIESKEFVAEKINLTLEYIMDEIKAQGIEPALLKDRIFVAVTEQNRTSKEGGTILITDGERGLFTSATISDRSLSSTMTTPVPVFNVAGSTQSSSGGGDTEIGITVQSRDNIAVLEEIIYWKRGNINDFDNLFNSCVSGLASLTKHQFWESDKKSDSFKVNDFTLRKLLGRSHFT